MAKVICPFCDLLLFQNGMFYLRFSFIQLFARVLLHDS